MKTSIAMERRRKGRGGEKILKRRKRQEGQGEGAGERDREGGG